MRPHLKEGDQSGRRPDVRGNRKLRWVVDALSPFLGSFLRTLQRAYRLLWCMRTDRLEIHVDFNSVPGSFPGKRGSMFRCEVVRHPSGASVTVV